MFDSLINYLDKFAPELLVIQFGFLVILSTLFLWLWFSNRRKYHNLKHAIPANVVKNYLDSIIQNSTALKSSLFRGGGLDVSGAVPSVIPLQNLTGGDGLGVSGAPSTALLEELNQKKAHIAALEAQLSTQQGSLKELETKHFHSQANLTAAEIKIRELEALLAKASAGAGGDEAIKAELSMVTRDRDEIRDKLKEFEIIADDLANLKRLQQENEQLKRSLANQGGAKLAPVPAAEPAEAPAAAADTLDDLLSSGTDDLSAATAAEDDFLAGLDDAPEKKEKKEKTSEDLLSEFEKMLG